MVDCMKLVSRYEPSYNFGIFRQSGDEFAEMYYDWVWDSRRGGFRGLLRSLERLREADGSFFVGTAASAFINWETLLEPSAQSFRSITALPRWTKTNTVIQPTNHNM